MLATAIAPMLTGCALQGPYLAPPVADDGTRLASAPATLAEPEWWAGLRDPAVDELVGRSLASHPSLDRALAVVGEARAASRASRAARLPALGLEAGATRERIDPASGSGTDQTSASAGFSLAWEIDLFQRLASINAAGARRLEGRIADAAAVRLSLAAEAADAALGLRACNRSMIALQSDILSRQTVLALTRRRRDAGLDADVEVALAETGLETARTALAFRRQECAGLTNALVALTGASREAVAAVLAAAPDQPAAPPAPDRLPARILLRHPGVAAAERDAAAAWSDIAAARAERMPRLNLGAALTGQWIRALGVTTESQLNVLDLSLAAPLFDGGRGAAGVEGAEARYAAAVADLDIALRGAAREVEDALAASASARVREVSARDAMNAAGFTLRAREAQWRAGAVSQFEVEEARRQFVVAEDSFIAASRDAAQAWVALVRAAGPAILLEEGASA